MNMAIYQQLIGFVVVICILLRALSHSLEPFCRLPFVSSSAFCTSLNPGFTISPSSNYVACWFGLSDWCAPETQGNKPQPPLKSLPATEFENVFNTHFNDISTVIDSSYRVNDALSYDLQQILLGINAINTIIRSSTLPSDVKETTFNQLMATRSATREANECIQGYLAKLNNGVEFISASAEVTKRLMQERQPHRVDSGAVLDIYSPNGGREKQAFLYTIEFFKDFSGRLGESNKECRASLSQVESRLDRLVQAFYDNTLLATKNDLAEARARLWNIFGGGKEAFSNAKDRLEVINRVGEGLQRLTSSTLFLDFHLQKLGIGANELSEHSQKVTQSDILPMGDVINLIAGGCASLRQTAIGWREHRANGDSQVSHTKVTQVTA